MQRVAWILATSATALAVVVACGGDDSRNRRDVLAGKAPPATAPGGGGAAASGGGVKRVDPATAGTIGGTVKFDGAAPAPEEVDLSGTPDCATRVGELKEKVVKEDLVVNDGKVANAFLFLEISDRYEVPAEPAVIDQIGCRYVPHVMGVVAGQTLHIKSSDSFLHNVHYSSKENGEDNFGMNRPGKKDRVFSEVEAGFVRFKCDIHPFMGAWMAVKSHPFFATSGADGAYTIKNVPPGSYTLVLKHEKLGEQRATVTVTTGQATTQDFTLR
jgi:plastocyanin